MARASKHVVCTKSDIEQLRILASDTSNPRLAVKAQIVLKCADGMKVKDIAAKLGERPNTVIQWRDRYIESGIKGLSNKPRGIGQIKYGDDFLKRLRSKLDDPPPDGMKRWSGKALAEELGVPLDAVWKYLRLAGIRLRDAQKPDIQPETDEIELPLALRMTTWREKDMTENTMKTKADIELVARIKNPDGTVIEKVVTMEDAVPQIKDFDFCTKAGFLRDLNTYEKAMIQARNQVMEDITSEYLDSGVKKKTKKDSSMK